MKPLSNVRIWQFEQSVRRTIPTKSPPVAMVLGKDGANTLHACFGVLTEIVELLQLALRESVDRIDAVEEIGDVAWYTMYAAICAQELGDIDSVDAFERCLQDCVLHAAEHPQEQSVREWADRLDAMVDAVKRGLFYGRWNGARHAVERSLLDLASDTVIVGMRTTVLACAKFDVDLEEALDHNEHKLALRYPDGYSHEAAAARADKRNDNE